MALDIEVQGIRLLVQNRTCIRICTSVTDVAKDRMALTPGDIRRRPPGAEVICMK